MRAKQSSTADGTYSSFGVPTRSSTDLFGQDAATGGVMEAKYVSSRGWQRADRTMQEVPADVQGEGLLHDARNLVSAIGLYCDLLSMPGVLKPEHQKYPEELRLLGTRSRVLIEHLMRSLVSQNLAGQRLAAQDREHGEDERTYPPTHRRDLTDRHPGVVSAASASESGVSAEPVSLRVIVERCSGLLRRVANGRVIELTFGAAADVPIGISEEAIERILVNLVRNASAALDQGERPTVIDPEIDSGIGRSDGRSGDRGIDPALDRRQPRTSSPQTSDQRATDSCLRQRRLRSASASQGRASIRIAVGHLLNPVEARPWPFQHVRLVVEDSGCGMQPNQLQSLLSGGMSASRGTHGIGFRVVRELVAASNGDLRAASTPGFGTRIQIEWPVAATPTAEKNGVIMEIQRNLGSTLRSPAAMELEPRSIPPRSLEPATIEGRQGAY